MEYTSDKGAAYAKYSYKKADGYFPGVATIGGLIVGVENRDGNANVRFHQADTLGCSRLFARLEGQARVVVCNFRADCGSRRTEFMEHGQWEDVSIGGTNCGVAFFRLDNMLPELGRPGVVEQLVARTYKHLSHDVFV